MGSPQYQDRSRCLLIDSLSRIKLSTNYRKGSPCFYSAFPSFVRSLRGASITLATCYELFLERFDGRYSSLLMLLFSSDLGCLSKMPGLIGW